MSTASSPTPAPGAGLRSVGLRPTAARQQVLQALRGNPQQHLTAEDVFQKLNASGISIGIATVYRTLAQLVSAGLVARRVLDENKAVYEVDDGAHHDHLVCLRCGRIDEFSNPGIEALQRRIARDNGYVLAEHRLVLYGLCRHCAGAGASPEAEQD
ncbi:MAG: transcriptional repressor [Burkholderiaceae bacterium]|jgi:Fur family ferric uptake transcriptional regulator|nr:transcriptional repressor [Burkholderiaceae bacterium]